MIINTGQRTDIPAFYSEWFVNRLKAGFVLVRNPYDSRSVTRYRLTPDVVDLIGFCTKSPAPMLPHMDLLRPFGQYWFVTVTPYGKEIEPHVPNKLQVLDSFRRLSDIVGTDSMGWRYDPVFISDRYPVDRHVKAFEYMAKTLSGYTQTAVISFIDLYEKTRRNFPEARAVTQEQRLTLGKAYEGKKVRLYFEGVYMNSKVYVRRSPRRGRSAPVIWAGTSGRITPAAICAGTATRITTRTPYAGTWRRTILHRPC